MRNNDESETVIGLDCGEKFFGNTFRELKRRANDRQAAKRRRERLLQFCQRAPALLAEIDTLEHAEYGGVWAYRSQDEFRRSVPREVVVQLERMAKEGKNEVFKDIQLSEQEREDRSIMRTTLTGSSGASHFTQHRMGAIAGSELWLEVGQLRNVLVSAKEALAAAQACKPDTISWKEEKALLARLNPVEQYVQLAHRVVAAARLFFERGNLSLLQYLPVSVSAANDVRRLKWSYPAGKRTDTRASRAA